MSDVLVIIFCDVEDFITPESDGPPKRLAQIMDKHDIKIVFKIVGEKLRALQKRNRQDVIEAMSHHEIGYHSNTHSVHPIIAEYVGNLGWDKGSAEFERREKPGYDEIRRVFGRDVSCYGHPGLCWVPQAYPVLKKWKIPVYLDENFTIKPLNNRPYWYCNILNLMGLGPNILSLDASDGPGNLPDNALITLEKSFIELYERLRNEKEVGLIALFCHPSTYATEEFWDKINFSGGRSPVDSMYKKPRVKKQEQINRDFENLEKFLFLAKSFHGIHFIRTMDALRIYADKADDREFSIAELKALCEDSIQHITFNEVASGIWVSAAEAFSMVLYSLSSFSKSGRLPNSIKCSHPLGPKEEFSTKTTQDAFDLEEFLYACSKEADIIRETGYLSTSAEIDGVELGLADMFASCSWLYLKLSDGIKPEKIPVIKGNFEVGRMVTEEGARIDWSQTYTNPEGFEAPKQTELARLQTWTLKPAVPDPERVEKLK